MDYEYLKVSDETGEAVVANIDGDRAISATTLSVDNVDNWPQKFIFATGTLDANNYIDPSTMTVMYGHLDAGNIIIDDFAPGYTDSGNSTGQVAIVKPNTSWANHVAHELENARTGWLDADETWTYSSATEITVPSDATTKYSAGMLIKLTQSTGGTKYFAITGVTSTALTIAGLDGAVLANEAITNPYYSHDMSPYGAPATIIPENIAQDSNWDWKPYTPTWTASSTSPDIGNGTLEGWYTQIGKLVSVYIRVRFGSTTNAGSGQYGFALPVTAASFLSSSNVSTHGQVHILDSGTINYNNWAAVIEGSKLGVVAGMDPTATGENDFITHSKPITFTNGDTIDIAITYPAA